MHQKRESHDILTVEKKIPICFLKSSRVIALLVAYVTTVNIKEPVIILKRFLPQKQKFSVLSRTFGKIEIVPQPLIIAERLWSGCIAAGILSKRSTQAIFMSQETELLYIPVDQLAEHINFIHQILEICYYFAPLDVPCEDLFDAVYGMLRIWSGLYRITSNSIALKRWYRMYILSLIGFVPQAAYTRGIEHTRALSLLNVDLHREACIELLNKIIAIDAMIPDQDINEWSLACIKQHPNFRSFKTIFSADTKESVRYA